MPEYIVELLVVVEADSPTDAEAIGTRTAWLARERAKWIARTTDTPRMAGRSRPTITNVIVADVRSDDE